MIDDLADTPYQSVLVIGGTRDLPGLWRIRRRGIPVVQRLDGMNWLHRMSPTKGSGKRDLRHYLRAEYGNFILAWIRNRLASCLVYQSEFARNWWERVYGPAPAASRVIYNGVDLDIYTPVGKGSPPDDHWRVLMVEGSLLGGYQQGLEAAMRLVEELLAAHSRSSGQKGELLVAGRVPPATQAYWQQYLERKGLQERSTLTWAGLVDSWRIPEIDRSAHLLYSGDIHAACPNSVIEALGCGLPVLAFDTGALPELVCGGAGRIVPYGGDPWKLEQPDVPGLARAAADILDDQARFRKAARARAEEAFGLDHMVDAYLEVLLA
jgi:glycosyltransferase involved in cell wall biosynthesis